MRDKARMVKLITCISKIWRTYPDLRLGQMIENVKPRNLDDLYYLEDSYLNLTIHNASIISLI